LDHRNSFSIKSYQQFGRNKAIWNVFIVVLIEKAKESNSSNEKQAFVQKRMLVFS
jgi:hypothetical protein